jgi:hypothetical protein
VTPQFVVPPTTVGVLTSVGGPRSFHQFERWSNSPTHSNVLKGINEATWHDSYENCSTNLTDRSFVSSHEGEKHLQRVRQPVRETQSCLITYPRMRVQKYTTPSTILWISLIPKLAPTQKIGKCRFDLGTRVIQFRNWTTSAGTGTVPKWGPAYTSKNKKSFLWRAPFM